MHWAAAAIGPASTPYTTDPMVRRPARASAVLLAIACSAATLVHPGSAAAMCFCMLRPERTVTNPGATSGLTSDPSYSPTAAVVMVRDGRRTVLTIEAAYQGPAVELSMVVPIPSAIDRDSVRTITGTAFRRLDARTAPRVRHVWPRCRPRPMRMMEAASADGLGSGGGGRASVAPTPEELGIEIRDEWPVAEYDVTLLDARESTGLLTFLRQRNLDLPERATTMLRGYIETGHRFVLLQVDPSRAQRLGESMMLSPIQIEYDADELVVPVRLGTLNSPGEQELLLYVLSPEGRFTVANRPNVEAPTDLRMRPSARGAFAELYNAVTDEIFRRTPGAAVAEYAHVVGRAGHVRFADVRPFGATAAPNVSGRSASADGRRWTVSRIRHRYGTDLHDDLMLQRATTPLRMTRRWRDDSLNTRAAAGQSGFQVQYVVEHSGCATPAQQRGAARRFATAESMWESRRDLWPGEVLVDPIPSLGIRPGSRAPAGWPPAPPLPAPHEVKPEFPPPIQPATSPRSASSPEAARGEAQVASRTEGAAVTPQSMSLPPPPDFGADAGGEGGLCAATPGRHAPSPWALLALFGLLALRRRRAPRTAPR